MKNKEIEIKIKVSKETFDQLKTRLDKQATFKGSSTQKDTYYSPPNKAYIEADGFIYNWLRIRKNSDNSIITYKKAYPNKNNRWRNNDEFETEIKDPEQIDRIVKALGLEILLELEKHRDTYIYKNICEIALDNVPGLGTFAEIELQSSNDDPEQELKSLVKELGLNLKDESRFGYPHLMLANKGITKLPDLE